MKLHLMFLLSQAPHPKDLEQKICMAAVAFANALGGQKPSISSHPSPLSPGKSIELRMKNFEQLRYLQQLFDDGILNDKEYAEQKANIISSLHKLS